MTMRFATLLAATRPAFLSVTLVGVILGLCTAAADGVFRSSGLAALTLVFALVAHAGANVINDYYDAISGCDAANTERIYPFTGGSRFIQEGRLTQRQTALLGYGLLALVIPAGLYLISHSGHALLLIGLCGLTAGWAYSAQPFKLQSRGMGELTITLAWLAVVMGSDYVQRNSLSGTTLIAGTAYALLVANVLFINQIPDCKADAGSGKKTLIVRLGYSFAPMGCAMLYALAITAVCLGMVLHQLPHAALASLIVIFPAIYSVAKLHKSPTDRTMLSRIIPLTIMTTLLFGMVLSLSLLID